MKYEVVGRSAMVPGGCVLKLSEDQVRRRRQHLEAEKGGAWRVLGDGVTFKQGERFELVSGHVDEKRGDLRAIGRPSPAEAKAAKRAAARKGGGKGKAAKTAPAAEDEDSEDAGLPLGGDGEAA